MEVFCLTFNLYYSLVSVVFNNYGHMNETYVFTIPLINFNKDNQHFQGGYIMIGNINISFDRYVAGFF